jgi:hypothetical protein
MRFWKSLEDAFFPAGPRRNRRRPRRVALGVESLEERAVPATLLVTSAADDGSAGTLRAQLNIANQTTGPGQADTIQFESGISDITLSKGPLEIVKGANVTIDGRSAVTIHGNTTTNPSSVFQVDGGAHAALDNLSITDGHAAIGGGIINLGNLQVNDASVFGNSATTFGGGIENGGTLSVNLSAISGNSSTGQGGGIYNNFGGVVTVFHSTISGNHTESTGGGIENHGGKLVVSDTTVSDNVAKLDGAGINNLGGATVKGSTFVDNRASGDGGGIHNRNLLNVSNSTFNENSAHSGGAFDNVDLGKATVSDSTLAGNHASFNGGGVSSMGTSPVKMLNTIVSGNSAANAGQDIFGTVAGSNNLVRNGEGAIGISDHDSNNNLVGSSAKPLEARLGPLADNGGPTRTMALQAGSPALAAGGALAKVTTEVDSTNTTIHVDDVSFASTQDPSIIQIGNEKMLVTAVDAASGTLTVQRGFDGSVASGHKPGEGVSFLTDQTGRARVVGGKTDIGAVQSQGAVPAAVVDQAVQPTVATVGDVAAKATGTAAPTTAVSDTLDSSGATDATAAPRDRFQAWKDAVEDVFASGFRF